MKKKTSQKIKLHQYEIERGEKVLFIFNIL